MTLLNAIMAIAIPWCWGSMVIAGFFPMLSPLGRIGIGWGAGLGSVTGLMFALSLLHIPFTTTNVTFALLLCTLALAWGVRRPPVSDPPMDGGTGYRDPAPLWLRQLILTIALFALALCAWRDAVWPISDWDALAVYDLRGRAFARFSSVAVASQHGDLTYALSLPPFTSFAHTWVYDYAGLDAPAKLLYVTCFAALIATFIAFVSYYRSALLAYLVMPGLLFSPLLGQAMVAYTNLPSAYTFFVASWASFHVLRTGSRRWVLLAGAFWSLAMWARQSLDPFIAVGIVALCLPWLRQRRIPWYPLLSAAGLLALPYAWSAYTQLVVYHTDRGAHLFVILRSLVIVFGPAIGISVASLAYCHLQRWPRVRRAAVAASIGVLIVLVAGVGYRSVVRNPSIVHDVFAYLRTYLWPLWGPLLIVFAACFIVGMNRRGENVGFVALFVAFVAVFVISTYIFAAGFSEWRSIPDSALRHSYAVIPVCWASIAIMPGTDRMIAVLRALRPAGLRTPAVQGD